MALLCSSKTGTPKSLFYKHMLDTGIGREGILGAKNSCSIPIIINDKYYESMSLASRAEGISRETIRDRLTNIKPEWVDWRFATEDEKLDYAARKNFSIGEILD